MKTYEVYWSIEIEAESEEDSIKKAIDRILLSTQEELLEDIQTTEVSLIDCEMCGGDCKQ